MGFSLTASAAILGVTLFIAAELITSDLLPRLEEINDSYSTMNERMTNQLQTDINITRVVQTVNTTNYDYNISVQNSGSVTLPTKNFIVLLNGTKYNFTCSQSHLYSEKTIYFTIKNIPGAGQKRIKVISNNGIADYFIYTP